MKEVISELLSNKVFLSALGVFGAELSAVIIGLVPPEFKALVYAGLAVVGAALVVIGGLQTRVALNEKKDAG